MKHTAIFGSFRINPIGVSYINHISEANSDKRLLVDTGISYNNEHYLRHLNPNVGIITKINPNHCSDYGYLVSTHLQWLGRYQVDIALIHFPDEGWQELAVKMSSDVRFKEVGVSNFNIDQLEEYKELIGHYPRYNQIENSINYYPKDLIEFCKRNKIELMCYGIFGGIHNAANIIRSTSVAHCIDHILRDGGYPIIFSNNYVNLVESYKCYMRSSGSEYLTDIEPEEYLLKEEGSKTKRALNKYVYPAPKFVNKVTAIIGGEEVKFLTLDSKCVIDLDDVTISPVENSLIDPTQLGYTEVDKTHMMVTEYLVDYKYKNSLPNSVINSYDDLITIDKGDTRTYYSVVILNNGSMVKSGQSDRVFIKIVNESFTMRN